jgi:hypothetical protein
MREWSVVDVVDVVRMFVWDAFDLFGPDNQDQGTDMAFQDRRLESKWKSLRDVTVILVRRLVFPRFGMSRVTLIQPRTPIHIHFDTSLFFFLYSVDRLLQHHREGCQNLACTVITLHH